MIYLLEDDSAIRELVVYTLCSTGLEATGFAAPSEFYDAMERALPELLILDEPLSGLDPINTDLFKGIIREEIEAGKYLIMSSHQMATVEEFCTDLTILDRSRTVRYQEGLWPGAFTAENRGGRRAVHRRKRGADRDPEGV